MKKLLLLFFILSILGILILTGIRISSPTIFLDGMGILIILIFTVIPLLWSSSLKDIVLGFKVMTTEDDSYTLEQLRNAYDAYDMLKKSLLTAFAFSAVFGTVLLLSQLQDPSTIGPMMAMMLLTLLYVSILIALILPIQLVLKKHINRHS